MKVGETDDRMPVHQVTVMGRLLLLLGPLPLSISLSLSRLDCEMSQSAVS